MPNEHPLDPPVPKRAPVSVDDGAPNSNGKESQRQETVGGNTRKTSAFLLVRKTNVVY